MNNEILSLVGYENLDVIDLKTTKVDNQYSIFITLRKNTNCCIFCNSNKIIIKDYYPRTIKHSHFKNTKAILIIKQRRFKCKECKRTFNEEIPITTENKSLSVETVMSILYDIKKIKSFTDIANEHNVSLTTVISLMNKHIITDRLPLPEVLSFDEFKNTTSGNGKYACLLVDFKTSQVVDVIPHRTYIELYDYFKVIPQKELDNVKYIVSDMFENYYKIARFFFHKATYLVDAFHLIRLVTESFNRVRIRVMKMYNSSSYQYKALKKFWKVLLIRRDKVFNKTFEYNGKIVTTLEMIDKIIRFDDELYRAYLLKEIFLDSYYRYNYDNAEAFIETIIHSFETSNIQEFVTTGKTFRVWKHPIINSFIKLNDRRISNGPTEGINKKIKDIKRVSYGYSNFNNFRTRIMYTINKYTPFKF